MISWKLVGDEKIICMRLKFLKKITKNGCPEGCFLRVWVSKRCPNALLAIKTMACLLVHYVVSMLVSVHTIDDASVTVSQLTI